MLFLTLLFLFLIATGFPIMFSLLVSNGIYIGFMTPFDLLIIPQKMGKAVDTFSLLAVPFFVMAGNLMGTCGVTERLVRLSNSLVGSIKGGFAQVSMLTGMFMAAISGSVTADAAALGSVFIPAMKEHGYKASFAAAVTASASLMGPIIPPSILLIFYGALANVSIGKLFLAGALPGLIQCMSFMVAVNIVARHQGYGKSQEKFSFREFGAALKGSILALSIPFIIIGGIISGLFTPTESGVIACIVIIFSGIRKIRLRHFIQAARSVITILGSVMIIVGGAAIFGYVLTLGQVGKTLGALFVHIGSPSLSLILISIMVLIIGLFVEGLAILMILIPVLVPIVQQFGVDPVHFGIVIVFSVTVGTCTPPMGLVMYIASSIADVEIKDFVVQFTPFFLASLFTLIIVILFPYLVLLLPNALIK